MSTAELIGMAAAVWFVGAVPVSLAVEGVLRRWNARAAGSRPPSVEGRHRRRTATADGLLAQPDMPAPTRGAAQVGQARGENLLSLAAPPA